MIPDPHRLFSQEDLEAIRRATIEAESRTSGEIVPLVVGSCADYGEALWKLVAFGAMLLPLLAAAVFIRWEVWAENPALWILAPSIVGAGAGFVLSRGCPACLRWLMDTEDLEKAVMARARRAFLEEEVFATRERTGILIFLSLFERRVVVMGDEGIHRAVEQHEWDDVVGSLIEGIRSGKVADALIQAIKDCGEILNQHGVEIRPDDTNELKDGLRMEDR